ncbi:DUF2007 domain-containing protein [Roseospira visakhapatnamensis]|uniref:DUF2007 domain-containing protein n=1 Tax=Roseospira visakhapatnamensis TaxID=390880 RepID=A0A7W6WBJ2_9PROT|nr:DUF2007 domain-containing protein [Roseospira visakhapatnamensis]MBB4268084.1 hypothetical protein [Roseospira visakhapatnamensis]
MEGLRELTVVGDRVFLSFLVNQLDQEGIRAIVFDHHTSAALGFAVQGLGVRVCVAEDQYERARWVLADVAPDLASDMVPEGDTSTEGRSGR